jgi:hypothetical protein
MMKIDAFVITAKTTNTDEVPALFQPSLDVFDRASQRFSYLSCPPALQSDWATFRLGVAEMKTTIQGYSDLSSGNVDIHNPPNLQVLLNTSLKDLWAGTAKLYGTAGMKNPIHLANPNQAIPTNTITGRIARITGGVTSTTGVLGASTGGGSGFGGGAAGAGGTRPGG